MGYTVYFKTTKAEDKILKEIFSDEWLESVDWPCQAPYFRYEDLSYVDDKLKNKTLFGIDYGEHYMANAIVATVAKRMGREFYLYDDPPDKCSVDTFFWWRADKETRKGWKTYRKAEFQLSKSYFKLVDKACAMVEKRMDEFL